MDVLQVARFNANSDRANLNCNRDPGSSNDSLGIAQKGFFKKENENI